MSLTPEEHDVICRKYINGEELPIDGMVNNFDKLSAVITYVLTYMELFTTSSIIECKTMPMTMIVQSIGRICNEMEYEYTTGDNIVVVTGIGNILLVNDLSGNVIGSYDESILIKI